MIIEIDKKQRIELAKFLMNNLDSGDWKELATLTDLEDSFNWQKLYQDVQWGNDTLKERCISAVNHILDSAVENIRCIWGLDNVQSSMKRKTPELFKSLEAIINEEELRIVESPSLVNASKNVFKALSDAELLIDEVGAAHAYDRVHTALHGFLQTVCQKNNIIYKPLDSITALLPKINEFIKLKVTDDGRNEKVFAMLRSANAILSNINELRNSNSMSHPTAQLLNDNDARFAINLARSIMTYIDTLVES